MKVKKTNKLQAICIMSNHTHEVYLIEKVHEFSEMLRKHHGKYAQNFNKKYNRSGRVQNDRAKIIQIEDESHEMLAVFYSHANPIRAGIVKDASQYIWSTHMLYAFGKKASWMKAIHFKFPDWYLKLGKTVKERRKVYRSLFDKYLRKYGLIKINHNIYGFGSADWLSLRRKAALDILSKRKPKTNSS